MAKHINNQTKQTTCLPTLHRMGRPLYPDPMFVGFGASAHIISFLTSSPTFGRFGPGSYWPNTGLTLLLCYQGSKITLQISKCICSFWPPKFKAQRHLKVGLRSVYQSSQLFCRVLALNFLNFSLKHLQKTLLFISWETYVSFIWANKMPDCASHSLSFPNGLQSRTRAICYFYTGEKHSRKQ